MHETGRRDVEDRRWGTRAKTRDIRATEVGTRGCGPLLSSRESSCSRDLYVKINDAVTLTPDRIRFPRVVARSAQKRPRRPDVHAVDVFNIMYTDLEVVYI